MMTGFKSGYTYIVKSNNDYWYIVRQRGQRTWDAMIFAQLDNMAEGKAISLLTGNGKALWDKLDPKEVVRFSESIHSNKPYRKELMSVLQYGELGRVQ
jgi:hypothetical protein